LAIFGPAGYGLRTGILAAPARVTVAAAPFVFGVLLDWMGTSAVLVSAGLSLAAFASLWLLRPRPAPASATAASDGGAVRLERAGLNMSLNGMRAVPFLTTAVFAGLLALPTVAQNPPEATTTQLRGTVARLEGRTLMLNSRDGQKLTIALAPNLTVLGMAKTSVDDVLTGDYVTAIGVAGRGGKSQAVEVYV